jgi:hypothetical protein
LTRNHNYKKAERIHLGLFYALFLAEEDKIRENLLPNRPKLGCAWAGLVVYYNENLTKELCCRVIRTSF